MRLDRVPEIVEWLTPLLDDDERVAKAAIESLACGCHPDSDTSAWFPPPEYEFGVRTQDHRVAGGEVYANFMSDDLANHIALWDPRRALAEVAAVRRHIARWEHVDSLIPGVTGRIRAELLCARRAYGLVIADDATVYADRPGYRDEWRADEPERAWPPIVHVQLSDRLVGPDDVVPCPSGCTQRRDQHRHLADGTIQTAYRGFGVSESGEVTHGTPLPPPIGEVLP